MAVVMSSIEAVKASISLVLAATIFGVSGICETGRHGVAHLLQVTSDCTALRSIAGVVDRECREAGLHDQCEASSDHSRPNFQGGCSCCLQECTTDLLGGDLELQEGRGTRKSNSSVGVLQRSSHSPCLVVTPVPHGEIPPIPAALVTGTTVQSDCNLHWMDCKVPCAHVAAAG